MMIILSHHNMRCLDAFKVYISSITCFITTTLLCWQLWAAAALLKQTCTQNYGATHLVIDRRWLIKESGRRYKKEETRRSWSHSSTPCYAQLRVNVLSDRVAGHTKTKPVLQVTKENPVQLTFVLLHTRCWWLASFVNWPSRFAEKKSQGHFPLSLVFFSQRCTFTQFQITLAVGFF